MSQPVAEITCQEFVELVTELIEGQLAAASRLEAEAHLADCEGCDAYLAQMRATIAGLRALAERDASEFPRTREQALAAFRELRGATGGPSGP
jgi:anti-sigma factor RsiW